MRACLIHVGFKGFFESIIESSKPKGCWESLSACQVPFAAGYGG